MPIITAPRDHQLHGARFEAYVGPSAGSSQLCAWRLTVDPGVEGTAHRVSHEEVLLVTDGAFHIDIDGLPGEVTAGDVVLVPAGALFTVSTGPQGGSAWVTTSVGLTATTADGTTIAPPWTR